MRVRLVCLEDGIMSCGFRKMAAYARRLHPDTYVHYVMTRNIRSPLQLLIGKTGTARGQADRAMTGGNDEQCALPLASGLQAFHESAQLIVLMGHHLVVQPTSGMEVHD